MLDVIGVVKETQELSQIISKTTQRPVSCIYISSSCIYQVLIIIIMYCIY
jgi:hypothetical protein